MVGTGVAGVQKYGVALDRRIWCPERLRSTDTELGGGGGRLVCECICSGDWVGVFCTLQKYLVYKGKQSLYANQCRPATYRAECVKGVVSGRVVE